MNINVKKYGDFLAVYFPFDESAKDRIKNLGGKWNGIERCWKVPAALESEVREVLRETFGTDGSQPVNMLTLRVTALEDVEVYTEPVTCCGKVLARAYGRDSGAKVGDDVALISGNIASGGSRKNWKSIVRKGAVFKLLNVFPGQKDDYDSDSFQVEVIDESIEGTNPLAHFSDDELLAEIRRRGLLRDEPNAQGEG